MPQNQGCQIFLCTKHQNGGNMPNYNKINQMAFNYVHMCTKRASNIPNGHKIKYKSFFYSKALQNIPNLGFWYKNIPSGNPAQKPD
jgi:hypothetical protein